MEIHHKDPSLDSMRAAVIAEAHSNSTGKMILISIYMTALKAAKLQVLVQPVKE